MNFREAKLTDLHDIATLHATSWQENYHTVLSQDYLSDKVHSERLSVWQDRLTQPAEHQYVLVAEKGGQFCGFICVYGNKHPNFGTIIDNLHVKSSCKGEGIGTQLMAKAAAWAKRHFANLGIYLEVLECNDQAMGFYQSLGASHADTAYWNTPCGNRVKEFIYRWESPAQLLPNIG